MSGDEGEMGADDARSAVASRSEVVWLGVAAAAGGVVAAAVGVRAAAAAAAAVEVAMVAVAAAAAAREAAREKAVSPETAFLASEVDWVGVVVAAAAAAARGGRAFLASAASSASVASPPGWGDKPRVVLALGMRPGIGPGLARQGLEQAEPN